MIAWAVVGHVARERQARALAWVLGAELHLDSGELGEWENHRRAWEGLCGSGAEFGVVVQDDAVPVAQILTQAPRALSQAPTAVVSLYTGRSYPEATVRPFRKVLAKADATGACWVTTRRLFWGVAVAIRTSMISDMVKSARRLRGVAYDERVSYWAQHNGGVSYCWPSLVDHADGPSLVPHKVRNALPRQAYRVGVRDNWTPESVSL